jgi:hypothetical protein
MKGFTLLSAVALTTMALTGVAFAQKAVSAPTLTEEGVRTVTFAGTVDMGALSGRAKPSDPLAFELDDDPAGDPDEGIEEALRRNIVDVEVVNDAATPFTSRFTTYLDENGRFTLPVTNAIASITVRRWDNGLKVTCNRPAGGWSTDVCNPTVESQQMTFGDVNGDGIIDDADLLAVLFGFGSSE